MPFADSIKTEPIVITSPAASAVPPPYVPPPEVVKLEVKPEIKTEPVEASPRNSSVDLREAASKMSQLMSPNGGTGIEPVKVVF